MAAKWLVRTKWLKAENSPATSSELLGLSQCGSSGKFCGWMGIGGISIHMDAAKPLFPGRAKRVALFNASQSPGDSATSASDGARFTGAGWAGFRAPKANIKTTCSRNTMATAAIHRDQLHFLACVDPDESALMVDWVQRQCGVALPGGR